jgi:predicted nucleic acid-binding protein
LTRLVIDASVAAKWFVPEHHHEQATMLLQALRAGDTELVSPDLIFSEIGSALCAKVRSGELSHEEVAEALLDFVQTPVTIVGGVDLALAAHAVVRATGASFYDAMYVAAAEAAAVPLITGDEELARLLSDTRYSQLVVRLADAAV